MKPITIAGARNVTPGQPESIKLKGPGGSVITCSVFNMLYDPFEKKSAPAREQTGKVQG